MALSDREQRLLDEMERHLYTSEADVLSTSRSSVTKIDYRAVVIGAVIAVVGLAVLLAGVMLNVMLIGVVGFAAMLTGVLYMFSPRKKRRSGAEESTRSEPSKSRAKASNTFATRMEQRWQERGEGQR